MPSPCRLNRASRGLLLDPMNGLADIERRELRAVSAYGFYDDPSRLLRLVRFRVRLGFTVEERTQMQVANAREAEVEKPIPPRALGEELRRIGAEDSPGGNSRGAGRGRADDAVLARAGRAETQPGGYGQAREEQPPAARRCAVRARRDSGPFLYVLTEKLRPRKSRRW